LQVFNSVKSSPEWNFLFLTKFPQRLQEINDVLGGFPDNAWVGTTVDTQARVELAQRSFANIQAKVKWLSCEPLLEHLQFTSLEMFDLVVIGGQSASYYNETPELQPEWSWVESLHNQARASGCAVYWKENLTVRPKEMPWMEV
jgi:protein gp37